MTSFMHTDLLWWYKAIKPHTGMVDLVFYDDKDREIETFQNPIAVSFKRLVKDTLDFKKFKVAVPLDSQKWNTETMDKHIVVTKILLNSGEGLMVHFADLEETAILDVVVKENSRPTFEEFAMIATVVTKNNSMVTHFFDTQVTTVLYMGVLVNRKMLEGRHRQKRSADLSVSYSMAYDNPKCLSWQKNTRSFSDTHCKVKFISYQLNKFYWLVFT